MDKRELVCHIVSAEWTMFDKVHNCGGRACCQDDWGTFEIMRGSQMEAWPEDLLNSYLKDLREAAAEERNLLCEKYAYMMERTYPEEYEAMRNRLPVPSLEKIWLTEWICDAMTVWQEETAVCYGPASAFAYRLGGSFPLLSEWVVPDSTSYYALSGRAPLVLAISVVTSFKMSFSEWM